MSQPQLSSNNTSHPIQHQAVVWYDGGCPLCQREIRYYQRLVPRVTIDWRDLSSDQPLVLPNGVSRCDALARFHMQDSQGRIHHGARGFIALWQLLPTWRFLGYVAAIPPLPRVLEFGYGVALKIRPRLATWLRRRLKG